LIRTSKPSRKQAKKKEKAMAVSFKSFAGQNWLITPAALAANEPKPTRIADQKWVVSLTGVGILDLQGNNLHDFTIGVARP
jgi:hypothetical protein